jgi:hypothetical protein
LGCVGAQQPDRCEGFRGDISIGSVNSTNSLHRTAIACTAFERRCSRRCSAATTGRTWRGKPIEFEKGKNGIAIPSLSKIPLVIDILITAVRNGELDAQLAQTKKPTTEIKSLKAA